MGHVCGFLSNLRVCSVRSHYYHSDGNDRGKEVHKYEQKYQKMKGDFVVGKKGYPGKMFISVPTVASCTQETVHSVISHSHSVSPFQTPRYCGEEKAASPSAASCLSPSSLPHSQPDKGAWTQAHQEWGKEG